MRAFILLIVITNFASTNVIGQNIIKGKVTDAQTNEALPGANVFLQSDWSIGSTTNNNGDFTLKINKSISNDTLIISYIGYRDISIPVSDKTIKPLIILLESFAELLGESVITARRIIAEEFKVKQVKQMEIYLNPAAKADALLAINAMPSSTTTDESASLSIRGSMPDETGVYLNDVPIYDAIRFSQLDGIGTFSIFNTDIIDWMQVYPGNPPLEYGNTSSGLVSLQTHNQLPEEPTNTLSLSLANFGGLTSRKLSEKTAFVLFGNYSPSKIFTGLNPDAMRDIESFNSFDLGFHIIHNINSKLRLKIFNYSNMEGYKYNMRTPSYTGIFDMNKKRNFTIANFISQKDNGELTINAGYNISDESYKYSITDISVDKQDVYLSSAYQHFFKQWSLKSGISFDYRVNKSNGTKPYYYYAQDLIHPTIEFKSNEEYYLPEAFLYTKFDVTEKLILGTGVRKNVVINHSPNYWSYQSSLNYKPNKNHSFILSAGHYNRLAMPNASQFEITLFESNQYSLDYTFIIDDLEIQASVFSKDANHGNLEDKIIGGEFYSKFDFKKFEFQCSFTTIDANINNGIEKYPSHYDLSYILKSTLKYKLEDFLEISAVYFFRQGTHYLPVESSTYDNITGTYYPAYSSWDNSERLPDYHKIDLSISKYWVVNTDLALVLYANVSNLLNTNNVRGINYNEDYTSRFNNLHSQRTIYFGVSVMF